jgi:hypothetical protein
MLAAYIPPAAGKRKFKDDMRNKLTWLTFFLETFKEHGKLFQHQKNV